MVECFHKEGETTRGCLQIDITKAYDHLNWTFVINILQAFEIPAQFIRWISECITTPTFIMAINGELVGFFPGKKGLRQGDPISSLLFVMAMDILAKKLDLGVGNNSFRPHPLGLAPLVTHLSFADDVLVFFDGTESSLHGVLEILEDFKSGSGLGISKEKTFLFLDGSNASLASMISESEGISLGSLPVRYLGVPLTTQKLRPSDYQPLVDNIKCRFTSWSARRLSFAGRLQLIQSVIYSTINFWASIFILPKKCIEALEQLCNAFLWKGAMGSANGAKISWDSCCTPKESGGLGLRRLAYWNKVLGLKLIWLLFSSAGSLWVSWVKANLLQGRNFWTFDNRDSGSWIWKQLCRLRPLARPFVICEVGSGFTASFWIDNWTGLGPLIDLTGENGPRTSGLPLQAVVADAIRDGNWWLVSSRSRSPTISPEILSPSGKSDCLQ